MINLCIQAELFIADAPNVYCTLTIGIYVFLLLTVVITLLTIVNYQIMKNILTSE